MIEKKNMLATIKDIVDDFICIAKELDRVEIPIFILCAGLALAAFFGFAILLLYVMCRCPIAAIVLIISFGIPAFAVWYAKHSERK